MRFFILLGILLPSLVIAVTIPREMQGVQAKALGINEAGMSVNSLFSILIID